LHNYILAWLRNNSNIDLIIEAIGTYVKGIFNYVVILMVECRGWASRNANDSKFGCEVGNKVPHFTYSYLLKLPFINVLIIEDLINCFAYRFNGVVL